MPQFFIDRPIFAWVVSLFILLLGLVAIPNMPVSQYPDVAPPAITITATYPGASPKEVAESVTSIIEDELNGAKGLLYYESVSDSYGQSEITVTFAPGTDPDLAQVDVQNRVSNVAAQLPQAVTQQGLRYEQTSAGFLMIVTLSSTDGTMDQTALADYVRRNVQNPVSRVPGVGRFQLFAAPRAMRIWVDPTKLVGFNLSMADVNQAISQQNVLISAGSVGAPPNPQSQRATATVVANGQLATVDGFGRIVLRANPDGSKVLLRDVQYHPFKQLVQHVDFQRVDARTRLTVKVPLHFKGEEESEAVKLHHNLVNHVMTELQISVLPADLPEFIEVDLSGLTNGATVHLSDLKLPKGAKVITHGKPNPVVVSAVAPVVEEEAAPADAAAAAAPAPAPAKGGKKK